MNENPFKPITSKEENRAALEKIQALKRQRLANQVQTTETPTSQEKQQESGGVTTETFDEESAMRNLKQQLKEFRQERKKPQDPFAPSDN